ncbi:hypothetical protein GF362_05735 [Candidatus Dojkabacteria bacterium]|nr:hypothetical protein [Candidatus Dojkabacteria bacterium]
MKHQIKKNKFASSFSQKKSIVRNLAIDLINHNHVTTTVGRAKAVRPFFERMISKYKKDKNNTRYIHKKLGQVNSQLIEKIDELCSKNFSKIDSGFVSMYKLGFRKGDGAEIVKLILEGYEPVVKSKLKKVGRKQKETEEKKEKKSGFQKFRDVIKKKDTTKSSQRKSVDSTEGDAKARSRSGI